MTNEPQDRTIDIQVAEKVMGWKRLPDREVKNSGWALSFVPTKRWMIPGGAITMDLPNYTTNIAETWEVLEKVLNTLARRYPRHQVDYNIGSNCRIEDGMWVNDGHNAEFVVWAPADPPKMHPVLIVEALENTPERAICAAALEVMRRLED